MAMIQRYGRSLRAALAVFVLGLMASASCAQTVTPIRVNELPPLKQRFVNGAPNWISFSVSRGANYEVRTLDGPAGGDVTARTRTVVDLMASDRRTRLAYGPPESAGGYGVILRWTADRSGTVYARISSQGRGTEYEVQVRGSEGHNEEPVGEDQQQIRSGEADIRYKMADMQLGNVVEFYRQRQNVDPTPRTREAVRRWDAGIRVSNIDEFERKVVPNRGWLVTRKGEWEPADGRSIRLTSD